MRGNSRKPFGHEHNRFTVPEHNRLNRNGFLAMGCKHTISAANGLYGMQRIFYVRRHNPVSVLNIILILLQINSNRLVSIMVHVRTTGLYQNITITYDDGEYCHHISFDMRKKNRIEFPLHASSSTTLPFRYSFSNNLEQM